MDISWSMQKEAEHRRRVSEVKDIFMFVKHADSFQYDAGVEYARGFMSKCAEYGLSPIESEGLFKEAQEFMTRTQSMDAIQRRRAQLNQEENLGIDPSNKPGTAIGRGLNRVFRGREGYAKYYADAANREIEKARDIQNRQYNIIQGIGGGAATERAAGKANADYMRDMGSEEYYKSRPEAPQPVAAPQPQTGMSRPIAANTQAASPQGSGWRPYSAGISAPWQGENWQPQKLQLQHQDFWNRSRTQSPYRVLSDGRKPIDPSRDGFTQGMRSMYTPRQTIPTPGYSNQGFSNIHL